MRSNSQHVTVIQHNSILGPVTASSQTYFSWPGSDTVQQNKRHSALEVIFASISSASDEEAQGIVRQIKSNRNLEDIAASIMKPDPSSVQTEDNESQELPELWTHRGRHAVPVKGVDDQLAGDYHTSISSQPPLINPTSEHSTKSRKSNETREKGIARQHAQGRRMNRSEGRLLNSECHA